MPAIAAALGPVEPDAEDLDAVELLTEALDLVELVAAAEGLVKLTREGTADRRGPRPGRSDPTGPTLPARPGRHCFFNAGDVAGDVLAVAEPHAGGVCSAIHADHIPGRRTKTRCRGSTSANSDAAGRRDVDRPSLLSGGRFAPPRRPSLARSRASCPGALGERSFSPRPPLSLLCSGRAVRATECTAGIVPADSAAPGRWPRRNLAAPPMPSRPDAAGLVPAVICASPHFAIVATE